MANMKSRAPAQLIIGLVIGKLFEKTNSPRGTMSCKSAGTAPRCPLRFAITALHGMTRVPV